jgi:hypothetical protein
VNLHNESTIATSLQAWKLFEETVNNSFVLTVNGVKTVYTIQATFTAAVMESSYDVNPKLRRSSSSGLNV